MKNLSSATNPILAAAVLFATLAATLPRRVSAEVSRSSWRCCRIPSPATASSATRTRATKDRLMRDRMETTEKSEKFRGGASKGQERNELLEPTQTKVPSEGSECVRDPFGKCVDALILTLFGRKRNEFTKFKRELGGSERRPEDAPIGRPLFSGADYDVFVVSDADEDGDKKTVRNPPQQIGDSTSFPETTRSSTPSALKFIEGMSEGLSRRLGNEIVDAVLAQVEATPRLKSLLGTGLDRLIRDRSDHVTERTSARDGRMHPILDQLTFDLETRSKRKNCGMISKEADSFLRDILGDSDGPEEVFKYSGCNGTCGSSLLQRRCLLLRLLSELQDLTATEKHKTTPMRRYLLHELSRANRAVGLGESDRSIMSCGTSSSWEKRQESNFWEDI